MRNDVKLGFAIGGVLLAVVIVFALVNSSKPPAEQAADQATAQQDKPADAAPVVETARVTRTETTTPPVAAATSTTPSGTPAAGSTPAATTTVPPVDPSASTTTPPAGATDPWGDALKTGKLPMLSNTAGSAASTPPSFTSGQPRNTTETPSGATSNTPVILGNGVNDRATSSRVTSPAGSTHTQQDDADRAVREGARAIGTSANRTTSTVTSNGNTVAARTHTIKSGETFSTIATAYYGHIRYNKLIAKANPGVDSSRLKIGQVINLPAFDPKTEAAAASPAALTKVVAIDSKTQYRVQKGDSLHAISMKLYGDAKHVDALYDTNKNAIGPVREKLKLDMILQLPAPPTVALK